MTLTELAIKRPSLIVIIFAALGVIGLFSYTQLSYELLPKISPPIITISTIYPGASPQEVESSVSKLVEEAVSSLDQISGITTTSSEGVSFVFVEFNQGANIDRALQDAQRKVGEVVPRLPSDSKAPSLSKFALDEIPVLRMSMTSTMNPSDFYQVLKNKIQPRIAKQAGVGQVFLVGGEEREIKINLDGERLRSVGMPILSAVQAIKSSNLDFPTGKIEDRDGQYIVRIAGKFESVEELRSLVIGKSRAGGDIKLSDVAEVQDGQKDRTQISRFNGVTSVGVMVQKQSDANAVDVSKRVTAELKKLTEDFTDINLKIDVAQDGSKFTVDAANAVKEDLMLAVLMVALVMLLFLHSIRNSLIVMISIPACLISTFIGMYAMGFSLNLMTLLGLSLVVGILVDDSIVVLENIYHHLEKGKDRRTAALVGRNEIGFAALAITLVDVVVFVPLAMTTGLIGNIMRQFALVVTLSTLLSLLVSFTITPMLASRFAKIEPLTRDTFMGRVALGFEALYDRFAKHYLKLLRWALGHRKTVGVMTIALLFGSCSLIPLGFIGQEFVAKSDRGEFAVTIELPPGATIDQTNKKALEIERMLLQMPEIQKLFANVGASNEGLMVQSSNNVTEFNVALVPKTERTKSTDQVGQEIKAKLNLLPGVKARVNPIGLFGTADQTPIQLIISGSDRTQVTSGAKHVVDLLNKVPGSVDVRLSIDEGKPETRIELDRQKLAAFGLNLAEVGTTLRVAFTGDNESKFRSVNDEFDIRIRLDQGDRSETSDVGDITFFNRQGQPIQLKQFASIYKTVGPSKLQRRDRNVSVTVFSQAHGRPSGTIAEDFKTLLEKEPMPQGTRIEYSGDLKNQAEGFSSMGIAMLAAIIFVYMIMVALYDSYVYPFVVLFSIPLAVVGALLALALAMKSMSIFSMLGLIMLIGLVAKNAILLVDRTNQTKADQNLGTFDALMEAGQARLRPILMTTLTMIIGMLPLALSKAAGSEWKTGLAWALIGGLTSSMMLTLIVVPIVYSKMDEWKIRVPNFFRRVFGGNKNAVPVVILNNDNGNGHNGNVSEKVIATVTMDKL